MPSLRNRLGVLNAGLAGNRLLHDSLGPNGLARFDHNALTQTVVTHVIVLLGASDIVNPGEEVTADQIIQGHQQLIERGHERGLKIYGGTLTPNEGFLVPRTSFPAFSPSHEIKRQVANAWIRRRGEYDEMIDFDRVLRDRHSPMRILICYDSGDHGHPNDADYQAMADAIHLKLFKNGESQYAARVPSRGPGK